MVGLGAAAPLCRRGPRSTRGGPGGGCPVSSPHISLRAASGACWAELFAALSLEAPSCPGCCSPPAKLRLSSLRLRMASLILHQRWLY